LLRAHLRAQTTARLSSSHSPLPRSFSFGRPSSAPPSRRLP